MNKETIKFFLCALVIALLMRFFVFEIAVVHQTSMVPTLMDADWLGISKLSYMFSPPSRGDIVVLHSGGEKLIKRIIGLPGENVQIAGNTVYIDGKPLSEPYLPDGLFYSDYPLTVVGPDSYFVLGDNRPVSIDSRDPAVGCVSKDDLEGRAVFRFLPPAKFSHVTYALEAGSEVAD